MDNYLIHKRIHQFFAYTIAWPMKARFHIKLGNYRSLKGPYLLLSNHNTDYDPIFVSLAMHRHLYYVASEHIFRKGGFLMKLVIKYFGPISRTKGSTAKGTVLSILRHLREGHSIGIFAEGNRSFDGMTMEIHPSTAKLVKICPVKVVTFRFTGGYFTTPRWGKRIRRGKMTGQVVGIYEPEQLKEMTVEEIHALLERDLHEDAYERQRGEVIRYRGKRRAELLETTLYWCPECNGTDTMRSHGNELICQCGCHTEYTETGFLKGPHGIDTITEWNKRQKKLLEQRLKQTENAAEAACTSENETCIFTDAAVTMTKYNNEHHEIGQIPGELQLYPDRLVCAGENFFLKDISACSIYGRNHIVFTSHGEHYDISAGERFCALKYLQAFEIVQGATS